LPISLAPFTAIGAGALFCLEKKELPSPLMIDLSLPGSRQLSRDFFQDADVEPGIQKKKNRKKYKKMLDMVNINL